MNYRTLADFCKVNKISCRRGEPMSVHTTFRIGGPADLFIQPVSEEALINVLSLIKQERLPFYVVGNGSNLLVRDEGVRGAVLSLSKLNQPIQLLEPDLIECAAGITLARLCQFALERELSGLEFACGIPGSVGGAVYMNAGAYGGEIKDVLHSAVHLNEQLRPEEAESKDLGLSYRHSIYSENGFIITRARFRLVPGDPAAIRGRMDDFLRRRRAKQPLEYPSAGSTFKRPAGGYASALIDQCGLKGMRLGGAMVSEKHAGFVINYENATCEEILSLIRIIQQKVKDQTGYQLECEVKLI